MQPQTDESPNVSRRARSKVRSCAKTPRQLPEQAIEVSNSFICTGSYFWDRSATQSCSANGGGAGIGKTRLASPSLRRRDPCARGPACNRPLSSWRGDRMPAVTGRVHQRFHQYRFSAISRLPVFGQSPGGRSQDMAGQVGIRIQGKSESGCY